MSSSNSSEAPNPGPEKKRRYLSAEKKFQLYLEAQDGKPVGELLCWIGWRACSGSMSSSKKSRIKRGPPPKQRIKRRNYRDALPELIRDFEARCAYSMQHQSRSGRLEVDHFDPRRKKDLIQSYANLFPASRHSNGKKSDTWPNKAERAAGCRFLNPCEEMDYDEQIFEDPTTHELVGVTPAAKWHIRVCGLNADHLIQERRRRAKHWRTIKGAAIKVKGDHYRASEMATSFREEVELMIPKISAPPL